MGMSIGMGMGVNTGMGTDGGKRKFSALKRVALVAVIAFSGAFQYGAAGYFRVAGVLPNLALVAAASAGFALGGEAGGFAGLCLGLYQDAQSGKILGMCALFYLYVGVLAGFFPKKSNIGDLPMALFAVYLLTVAYECAVYLFAYTIPVLRGGLAPGVGIRRAGLGVIVPSAFINSLWSVPYYFILRQKGAAKGAPAGRWQT